MTLNVSGPISIAGTTAGQSIQIELGGTGSSTMSLNCAAVRTLAGVPTGAIVMPTNFWGKSNIPPFGCATYTTAGTYSFVVPSGVTTVSVVCVGAGGSGLTINCLDFPPGGGGGGALSYTNNIPTTAGETLTVTVGAGVARNRYPAFRTGAGAAPAGGPSSVARGGTVLISAAGGAGGFKGAGLVAGSGGAGGAAGSGVGSVRYSGGSGSAYAGGGAAGYGGNGGAGAPLASTGSPGTGGAAGGGGASSGTGADQGGSGGGVGLVVVGASGAGGSIGTTSPFPAGGGGGGSGGATGGPAQFNFGTQPAGIYGGGGGAAGDTTTSATGGESAVGGVRIIYGGTGKTYPNNSAP